MSFFTNAAKDAEEANLAAARATMEYTAALNDLADAKRLAASETIFGTDELGQVYAYNEILRERTENIKKALDEYIAGLKEIQEAQMIGNSVLGGVAASPNPDVLGGLQPVEGLKPYFPAEITADLRTGWQKFWGSDKNVFTFDLAGIIDASGEIDEDRMEKLRTWYEQYGEGLDEEHRIMVDRMISDWDAYQEALEGVKEFANSLFGSVASDVADAVLSGTGNLEAEMDEILADINRKVVKAMIENRVIADVFNDKLQEDIIEALKNGDVALANQLFQGGMDRIEGILPDLRELAESVGAIDTGSSSSSTGNTALSSVSQESFDMYSGRVANIQTHVISIDKGVLGMAANSTTIVNILNDISGDTARLEVISADIASMRTALSEIVMDGLKVR